MVKKRTGNPGRADPETSRRHIETVLKTVLYLSIFGAILSIYILTVQVYSLGSFCRLSSTCDCDTVIRSGYSSIAGVPTALLSLEGYIAFMVIAGILLQRMDHNKHPQHKPKRLNLALMILSLIGFIYMTYFTYIQAYAIKAWCLLHILLYITIAALLALTVINYIWRRNYTRLLRGKTWKK
ncbi:vitamin K epoxide reductase family protein [Candidatus Woesearchaeota archaeon]|nr:vitamin K epoxide reductase family protein [Candidatus Woesearchaeota archaeon]